MTLDRDQTLDWLIGIFERRTDAGDFFYTNETLLGFLPVMLMSFGFDASELPPKLELIMADFADRAGVTPAMTPLETERALASYIEAHPLDEQLVFEFNRGVREERVTRGNEDVAEAFAKYLADSDRNIADLFGTHRREAKEGAVAAGPMAMFLLRDD